ncbi:Uncharacterized protein Rs2_15167 [Raphanus sativus]|nr:Uncharacterized protein Rs2_15167 [Raphanus sativus]
MHALPSWVPWICLTLGSVLYRKAKPRHQLLTKRILLLRFRIHGPCMEEMYSRLLGSQETGMNEVFNTNKLPYNSFNTTNFVSVIPNQFYQNCFDVNGPSGFSWGTRNWDQRYECGRLFSVAFGARNWG